MSVFQIASFLRGRAGELKPSTYRQYSAAVLQLLRDGFDKNRITESQIIRVAATLKEQNHETENREKNIIPCRTSAGRLKQIGENKIDDLVNLLLAKKTQKSQVLAAVVYYGTELGLRPTEWLSARFEDDCLIVKTAKFSEHNGRGIAEYRSIDLSLMSDSDREFIAAAVRRIQILVDQSNGNEWLVYRSLARLLTTVRDEVGLPKLTLRSLRHQARSNLVSSGFNPFEVAAILGHSSSETGEIHYGVRKGGWAGIKIKVQPDPNLVAMVRPGATKAARMRKSEAQKAETLYNTPDDNKVENFENRPRL